MMEEGTNPDLQNILRVLLSKPELVETIRKEVLGQESEPPPEPIGEDEKTEEAIEETAAPAHNFSVTKKREQLLCALKPYLSPGRAKMIETALTLAKIVDSVRPV